MAAQVAVYSTLSALFAPTPTSMVTPGRKSLEEIVARVTILGARALVLPTATAPTGPRHLSDDTAAIVCQSLARAIVTVAGRSHRYTRAGCGFLQSTRRNNVIAPPIT